MFRIIISSIILALGISGAAFVIQNSTIPLLRHGI